MAAKKKKTTKKRTKCRCFYGWVCEIHPNQPWKHGSCEAAGDLCKNPQCDKDPDSAFIYWDSPAEENRQSEELHSTLKVYVDSLAAVLRPVVPRSVAP
jgi:hypothetical protein